MKRPRKTHASIHAEAYKCGREETIAEACRVLKHHLGCREVADELWRLMTTGAPTRQIANAGDRTGLPD